MNLGERIKHAIGTAGVDVRAVASACDISVQAAYAWMRGDVKDLRNANLFALSDLTGFEARWIGTGAGPEKSVMNEPKVKALVGLFEASDDRGRASILRTAEQESHYSVIYEWAKNGTK